MACLKLKIEQPLKFTQPNYAKKLRCIGAAAHREEALRFLEIML